jgi:hypothetical protein
MSLKRRRARESLRKLGRSIEKAGLPAQPNVYHVAALTSGLIEILGGRERGRAAAAARYLYRIAPQSFQATGVEAQLDCRRGCAYCCHGYVSATAPQVFAAADAVRAERLTFAAALERLRSTAARVHGLGWRERIGLRLPCPLLVDNACSIYAARPLSCRGYVSLSVAACARAFEDPSQAVPMPPAYASVRSALEMALRAALKANALPHASYELNGALTRALELDEAQARWLAGEPVFDAAGMDRSADPAAEAERERMLDALVAIAHGEEPDMLRARLPG